MTGNPLSAAQKAAVLASVEALREHNPLVQCLTNKVVAAFTANALLAAGAAPAMIDTPSESFDFATVADAVLVNAGTPSEEQFEGMRHAIAGATTAGVPWVLDPVAAGSLKRRKKFYRQKMQLDPTVIRGNASEIAALAKEGGGGRGTDATQSVEVSVPAALKLNKKTGAIIAMSGPVDIIVSEAGITRIEGGHPLLQKVTGTGCFLGALCAAYAGAANKSELVPHLAVVAAHAHASAAGTRAGAQFPRQPGSFAVAFLDALYELDGPDILELVEISHEDSTASEE